MISLSRHADTAARHMIVHAAAIARFIVYALVAYAVLRLIDVSQLVAFSWDLNPLPWLRLGNCPSVAMPCP